MKILATILAALTVLDATSSAGAQEASYYGRIFFYNNTGKPAHVIFADKRAPIDVPARLIMEIPVRSTLFEFTVELESFQPLEQSHYLDKPSFADAKGGKWICMLLNVPRGEYYHPELKKLSVSECAGMVKAG